MILKVVKTLINLFFQSTNNFYFFFHGRNLIDLKEKFILRIYGLKVLSSEQIILFQGPLAVAVPGEIDGYYQVYFVHNNPDAETQRSYA